MATWKKIKSREGLLFAASRKLVDITNNPSPRISAISPTVYTGTQAATGTSTIYTCPSGKRARITYMHLAYSIGGGLGELQFRDVPQIRAIAIGTTAFSFSYETALVLEAGQTVAVRASVAGTSFAVVHVVEESI